MDFRPESYWSPANPQQAILANVKGDLRREMIRDLLRDGVSIEADILEENAPDDFRALQRMDPRWMGGEYLPDHLPGEVEIARLTLASVTQDVYSFRVRRGGGGRIRYRVVDEYNTVFLYSPASSKLPLTMERLVRMIDTLDSEAFESFDGDFTDALRYDQQSPEDGVDFVTVTSEYYPDLRDYYEHKAQEWYERQVEEAAEPEEED